MPHRKSLGLIWRRMGERYRMEGTKCESCGNYFFPTRLFCPYCRRKGKIVPHKMEGKGKVYSYTIVHSAQEGFKNIVPYVIAIVRLDEGPKVMGQVRGLEPGEISIGMPVKAVFRKMGQDGEAGIIHYSYKFVKA